ncbi:MAG: VWA domain-containing protein [Solirubrobacteraceae bacterium]
MTAESPTPAAGTVEPAPLPATAEAPEATLSAIAGAPPTPLEEESARAPGDVSSTPADDAYEHNEPAAPQARATTDDLTQTLSPAPAPAPPSPVSARSPVVVIGQVLPIYFVGDESHSMSGDPIGAVNQGLADLRDEVAKHPLIGKKVRFGIVTFAHSAEIRLELSELTEDLALPTLSPRGRGTSYASAFALLRQTIPGDIAALKGSGFQVHRPVVFFLSDGQPTERDKKWRSALSELGDDGFRERPNILAFGVGEADPEVIRQIASSPRYAFMMRDGASTAGAISEFATSMLNSMVASAERLDRGEQTIEFEKPEGFVQLDAPLL